MKKFITKILDTKKLILTIWIILWLILVILLVLKFCFNMWYPIVVDNKAFMNICNYIDNNKWLSISIMFIFYFINLNMLSLINMNKKKYDNIIFLLIINSIIITSFTLKNINNTLGSIFELCFLFLAFCIVNLKQQNFDKKWKDILVPILTYALLNIWQFTIYFVRGLDINQLSNYPSLIYIILQLDYYIFITITWIGVSFMGLLGAGWLWSKDVTVLKAEKEKELAKSKPDMKLIAKIDERIAELEKESK